MSYCTNCGNQVQINDNYCSKCGASQNGGSGKGGDIITCGRCGGSGEIADGTLFIGGYKRCPVCNGKGKVRV